MKKASFTLLFAFYLLQSFSQENKNQKLQYASEVLTGRINQLSHLGYEITAVTISKDFGGLEVRDFNLLRNKIDTVFVESYAIYKDASYGVVPGTGLTITKTITSKTEKTNTEIKVSNVEQFFKPDNLKNVYRFKSYYIPTAEELHVDYKTSYKFNMMLVAGDIGTQIGSSKDLSMAMILIIYVRPIK